MRTKIYNSNNNPNRVFISHSDGIDEYFVPMSGGYVRDQHGKQVCDNLLNRGDTLRFGEVNGNNFLNFIRKQWAAHQRVKNRQLGI